MIIFPEYLRFGLIPLSLELFCLLFKAVVLGVLYKKRPLINKGPAFTVLVIVLFTGSFTNITIIAYLLSISPFSILSFEISKMLFRLENAIFAVQLFSLLCFFRELSSRKLPRTVMYFFFAVTTFFVVFWCYRSIYSYILGFPNYTIAEEYVLDWISGYILFMCALFLLLIYRNYKIELIKLLKQHNYTLGLYFMLPYFIMKVFESSFISRRVNFPAATITSLLLTGMIYYCFKKLAGIRFLNMRGHVSSKISEQYNFLIDFKEVFAKLSVTTNVDEIMPITKAFFKKAFNIDDDKMTFRLRESYQRNPVVHASMEPEPEKLFLEKIFNTQSEYPDVVSFVKENKIIIRDEVEFTHFYHDSIVERRPLEAVIEFLKQINADVFLPIYSENKLAAYITIDHGARGAEFYTDVERDQMLIYCSYIGGVIGLLGNIDMETISRRDRQLRYQLYAKERKIALFRTCVKKFIGNIKTRKIGVLTYKNKKFSYCNQAAKDLIKVDLNKDKGLPFTQQVLDVAHSTALYLSPKRILTTSPQGDPLVVSATPNLQKSNTIVSVHNPGIADYVKDSQALLKDDRKWPYLLALRTSDEGVLVNQLIPAETTTLLNCKISFFERAIICKTLLFEMSSEEDAIAFAHVVHKIQGRSIFEEIALRYTYDDEQLAMKLFGINPLFEISQEKSLFEQLNGKGTLFIRNVHFLSMAMQKRLLEYMLTGKFTPLKSDKQIVSDVLILYSTTQNLQDLVHQGLFLKTLYLELQRSAVWLPSLTTLPQEEFLALAEGLRRQVVHAKMYQNMLVFTESDRRRLLANSCVSLHELKSKVQNVILKKTRKQSLKETAIIDPAYNVSDLDLVEAARLGRHALKDPKILSMLLRKFKNNQSRVALFLGVNRSTVHRRCAQFGFEGETMRTAQKESAI